MNWRPEIERPDAPPGLYQVPDGPILADDLVYCWTSREFLPADSPDWTGSSPVGQDAGYSFVYRRPGTGMSGFYRSRSYTITRPAVVNDPKVSGRIDNARNADPSRNGTGGQGNLF